MNNFSQFNLGNDEAPSIEYVYL